MMFVSAYRQITPTEKAFVDSYVADLETAAVRAGEKLSTFVMRSIPAPDARSHEIAERSLVRAAIAERVREISDAMELSAYRVLKELGSIAFSNIGDYMKIGEDGHPVFDMTRCTREQLAAVSSIKISEDMRAGKRTFEFKLHDKIAGLTGFMRYMGLLDGDNPHYRAEVARNVSPNGPAALPASVNDEQAADAYARLING